MKSRILPRQKFGTSTGARKKVVAPSRTEAIRIFSAAKERMLDINRWKSLCGELSAEFTLTGPDGVAVNRKPEKGDLIRIDLPAPGNPAGEGSDWVRIEEFEERKNELRDEEIFGFRVRPVPKPGAHTGENAHFYEGSATSTFLITRSTSIVIASEQGRNEKINTGVRGLWTKIRNFVIAVAAMMGLARPQWKSLVAGILEGPR